MPTIKLYENDSYIKNFSATVVSCEEKDGAYSVVLTQTAFFPEGGGQDADKGKINDADVLDVQIKNDVIYHKVNKPFNVNEEVTCTLDWETRFSRMQNHTGEHIVSGVIHSLFGYNNVGFHMNDTLVTLDVDGPLSDEDIKKVELTKKFMEQIRISKDVMHSRRVNRDIRSLVKGLMIESYIEDGAQKIGENVYGKSITDPCLGWEKTEKLIYDIAEKL